jgi:hypothetical protein
MAAMCVGIGPAVTPAVAPANMALASAAFTTILILFMALLRPPVLRARKEHARRRGHAKAHIALRNFALGSWRSFCQAN